MCRTVSNRVLRSVRTDGDHYSDWRVSDGLHGCDHGGGIKYGSILGCGSTGLLAGHVYGLRGWIRSDDNRSCLHGAVYEGQGETRRNKINPLTCARGQRANEG